MKVSYFNPRCPSPTKQPLLRFARRLQLVGCLVVAVTLIMGSASAESQNFPSRLVRFIVPFPAGGGVDLVIRAVAQELNIKWGTPVIVENRTGAGGTVGTDAVFRAAPDGYVLLATVNQTITTAPFLFKSLPYDPLKLMPVTQMVQSDNFILAHPDVPAKDLRELVDLVRKEPKKWTYGSFGRGSQPQLLFEYLNHTEGLDLLHIPYNGISPLLIAMITGEVSLTTGSAGVAGEYLRSGKLKALAIAGKKRSPQFPDVPTTNEAGFGYIESSIWYGVFAPPDTPREIINKLSNDLRAILTRPDFVEHHIASKGLQTVASTPEELDSVVKSETETLRKVIGTIGISAE